MPSPDYTPSATAATGLSMHVTGVTFSYGTLPTVVTFAEVTGVKRENSADVKKWSANAAYGPTHKKLVNQERKVTLTVGDAANADAIPANTVGTLVWTVNDLYNGVGVGSRTYTLRGASMDMTDQDTEHNEFSKNTVTFTAVWLDGVTDPLTVVQN